MHFSYADTFGGAEQALDAYERLIHDVMVGDRTLFTSSDAIERLWEISEPVLEDPPPVLPYEPGSWGPAESRRPDRPAPLAPAQPPRLSVRPAEEWARYWAPVSEGRPPESLTLSAGSSVLEL